jgi:hypothetical protein
MWCGGFYSSEIYVTIRKYVAEYNVPYMRCVPNNFGIVVFMTLYTKMKIKEFIPTLYLVPKSLSPLSIYLLSTFLRNLKNGPLL